MGKDIIERYSEKHWGEAMEDLRAELALFAHDGLVQLRDDLAHHAVMRGSWAGCALSYKCGAPGSARRDRLGRARNAFTVLWDNGGITDDRVRAEVEAELARRTVLIPTKGGEAREAQVGVAVTR